MFSKKTVSEINVEGMTCSHCKGAVEKAVKDLEGVKKAVADVELKKVTVTHTEKVTVEEIKQKINDVGFEAK